MFRLSRRFRLRVAALMAALFMLPAMPASAAPVPSLQGEIFDGSPNATLSCSATGNSVITFASTGFASGPYPGTYTESGTIVIGPLTNPDPFGFPNGSGVLVDVSTSFTIDSPAGMVTGTKYLIGTVSTATCVEDSLPLAELRCEALFGVPGDNASLAEANVHVGYDARIDTPSGSFADSGEGFLLLHEMHLECPGSVQLSFLFREGFVRSDGLTPIANGPASISLTPPDAVNDVGTTHTVNASVRDAATDPVSGVAVRFAVSGSTSTSGSCTTDAAGQCAFAYSGPLLPGADIISAYADTNGDGTRQAEEPMAEATKAWILPSSTSGQTTGGGQVYNNGATDKIAFGYNAQSTPNGLRGNCEVVDPTPSNNVKIKCLDVTTLVQSGTHATFFGNATVNGNPTTYRVDVDDLGEPGAGQDTFRIVTGTGYSLGGTLTNGNIQVHN